MLRSRVAKKAAAALRGRKALAREHSDARFWAVVFLLTWNLHHGHFNTLSTVGVLSEVGRLVECFVYFGFLFGFINVCAGVVCLIGAMFGRILF